MLTKTLGSFTLIAGCAAGNAASPSTQVSRLRFEIHVPDQMLEDPAAGPFQNSGRPVEMRLINDSHRALWINNPAGARPRIVITIRGQSGDVPFLCSSCGDPRPIAEGSWPSVDDYAVLKPGDKVTVKWDGLYCYRDVFARPGTYTACGVYRDKNPRPPPPRSGAEPVSEEVFAQPVQFQVVAR
jgi:hypothetical protein